MEFVRDNKSDYKINLHIAGDPESLEVSVVDEKCIRVYYKISEGFTKDVAYTYQLPEDADSSTIKLDLDYDDLEITIGKLTPYVRKLPINVIRKF